MPNAGKLFEADAYQWVLNYSLSDSTAGTGLQNFVDASGGSATLEVDFAGDPYDVYAGIVMELASTHDGSFSYHSLAVPPLGISIGGRADFASSLTSKFRLLDPILYATLYSQYRLVWSGWEYELNGAVVASGPGGELVTDYLAQGWIPLLGSGVQLYASASPACRYDDPIDYGSPWHGEATNPRTGEVTPVYPPGLRYLPFDALASARTTATGGWEWLRDGSWQSDPIDFRSVGYSDGITADRSNNSSIWAEASHHQWRVVVSPLVTRTSGPNTEWAYAVQEKFEDASAGCGYIQLWPAQDASLRRMVPEGHAAVMYRFGLPGTTGTAGTYHQDAGYPDGETSTTTTTTVLPTRAPFLGVVRDGAHALEDPLTDGNPSPYRAGTSQSHGDLGLQGDDCGIFEWIVDPHYTFPNDGWPGYYPCSVYSPFQWTITDAQNSSYPSSISMPSGYVPLLTHPDPYVILLQMRSGLWHQIGHWFPPNTGGDGEDDPGSQSAWPIDGGPIANQAWKALRMQWEYHPSLPSVDATKRNTDLIAGCVDESGHTPHEDGFYAEWFRWAGATRWVTMPCTPGASKDYDKCPDTLQLRTDSGPSWRSDDAALTFDASGVHIAPHDDDVTSVTITLDLAGWEAPPYLYPAACSSVVVGFDGPDKVDVSFASALGGSAHVGEVTDGQTVSIPRGSDGGYAGSWGMDNGGDFTVDVGTDVASGGQSAATMAAPSRIHAFDGLVAKGANRLVFVVTLGDDHNVLRWPTFVRAAGKPWVVWETGAACSILYPDGPAVRFGNWQFFDPDAGFLNPPVPAGLGYKATIIDGISWRRAVMQGVSPEHGGDTGPTGGTVTIPPLTTELVDRFDTYEGQSIAVVDKFSISFVLPVTTDQQIKIALVNTMAETPPVALMPTQGRNLTTWEYGGASFAGIYDLTQEPRFVSSPNKPLIVKKPDGTTVSTSTAGPSGWAIQRYSPVTNNDETANWIVAQADKTIAHVRPRHGWLYIGKVAEGNVLALLTHGHGRIHRVVGKDGTAHFGATNVPGRGDWKDRDLSTDATEASLQRGNGYDVITGLIKDGALTLRLDTSEGLQDPTTTMDAGSATSHDLASFGDGQFALARIDGGTLKLELRRAKDLELVGGPYETSATDLSDSAAVRIDNVSLGGNKPGLIVAIADGGDTTTYLTTDLQTLTA